MTSDSTDDLELLLRRIRTSLAERELQLELTEAAEDFLDGPLDESGLVPGA